MISCSACKYQNCLLRYFSFSPVDVSTVLLKTVNNSEMEIMLFNTRMSKYGTNNTRGLSMANKSKWFDITEYEALSQTLHQEICEFSVLRGVIEVSSSLNKHCIDKSIWSILPTYCTIEMIWGGITRNRSWVNHIIIFRNCIFCQSESLYHIYSMCLQGFSTQFPFCFCTVAVYAEALSTSQFCGCIHITSEWF